MMIINNLFLIGLMGAGKTTLGKRLAKRLNFKFCDSDAWIVENCGKSIAQIFAESGEAAFRQIESQALKTLCQQKNLLLATGGGAPLLKENQVFLKNNGFVVYLHATPKTLASRIANDTTRPLLNVENPLKKLESLYAVRHSIYTSTAYFVLNIDDLPLESAQHCIINDYENFQSQNSVR